MSEHNERSRPIVIGGEDLKDIKMYVNGTFREYMPAKTIVDFPSFVSAYAKQEGIKNYQLKVNGDPLDKDGINRVNIDDVSSIEINTFDVART